MTTTDRPDETDECYSCMVGVATGPESHDPDCPVRRIPMPEQDGKFGPEWADYDFACEKIRRPGSRSAR